MTTTEQEIDAMSGPQLERLIAQTKGWHLHPFTHRWYDPEGEWTFDEPPKVTSDPAAAWELQTTLSDLCKLMHYHVVFIIGWNRSGRFVQIALPQNNQVYEGTGDTWKLAQARAAAKCLLSLKEGIA